ncbi:OLC1v1013011C2 [Oldenlandia corymbosa var. corymbosa]|uniref:OLC1v1013011C2 n=1 Tax=Oldenlandia corymbosa var. corymbosa TaxID=529605 RepID=A0AAV1DXJ1_OLDCO|nr:OLC1v1013011C2 [Oldenlandia corymbosa var. corymbosa]
MGNCQAIDNASLVIQHPNGRADKLYTPVTASEIMKMNPGHYVALLLTTTFCPPSNTGNSTSAAAAANKISTHQQQQQPLRITRIKLLKPTDTLLLGHVYRLITNREVMKGLWAKKYAKMKKQLSSSSSSSDEKEEGLTAQEISDLEEAVRKYELDKNNRKVNFCTSSILSSQEENIC